MKRIRNLTAVILLAGTGALAAGEALAQTSVCSQLQSQYRAVLARGGGSSGSQMVNIDRLRQQMAEAQIAADRGNCQAIGFLFLKPRKSPQCPSIVGRLRDLSNQIAQARGGGLNPFRRSTDFEQARLRDSLRRNGCRIPQYYGGGSAYRTVCVRLCDGYYFPINFQTGRSRFETDAEVCQSMYAQPGQAELFFYPNRGDVADAQSMSGERYEQQLYAFNYRSSYDASCAAELTDGIRALGLRYLTARQQEKYSAQTATTLLALPTARPVSTEDPETIANREGDFTVRPIHSSSDFVAAVDNPDVRIIGSAYYADLFDVTKPLPSSGGPDFGLIGSAQAGESLPAPAINAPEPERVPEPETRKPTLGAATPDVVLETPQTTVQ